MKVRILILGRAYDRTESLPDEITLPDGATLDDALARLESLAPGAEPLPETCLVAVSGNHLGTLGDHRAATLQDGDELALIAPVAGG